MSRPRVVGRKVQAVDENGIYFAGKVIGMRKHAGKPQELIRWQGYGTQHNAWVDSQHVRPPATYRLTTTNAKRAMLKHVMREDKVKVVTANAPGQELASHVYDVDINDPFNCRVSVKLRLVCFCFLFKLLYSIRKGVNKHYKLPDSK